MKKNAKKNSKKNAELLKKIAILKQKGFVFNKQNKVCVHCNFACESDNG